ncbi:acyl-CoA dehydrogenase family protein [Fluviispira multicolorata]|uniref:Isovaleryl-CoA dehydrogenase n=1 Tax=Fluviispira multicolorata TaxID=2654512 RepID=A0A833N5C4_9BACT|nr:acyl-CoA dehydrogenase family protein [Fluviispira multicolorata]KAB8033682.1 isovaleryl-CoA dehydrogenase [Fluviispira multicolorata]
MTNYHSNAQEIREVIQTVRAFAAKELAPYADELDREERLAPGIFRRLGELGILGLTCPEEFGGAKLGAVSVVAVMEELSYACPGTCLSYLAHALLFTHNFAQNASPEQLVRYLPNCISGEMVGGMGMTEPSAGSDAIGMKTRAVRRGDHYVINGSKMFITNGPVADIFLVYARTGDNRNDLSTFIIERGFQGFSVGKKLSKMGMRASPTGELIFKDCIVPAENLVGSEGSSVKHMMKNLDIERVGLAAMSLGIARACLDHSLKYAQERQQFNENIINFQSVSEKIANMYIGYRAARAFVYEAAQVIEEGRRANQEAAAAKVFASEMATKVALDAIQVLGGYGYIREFPVERLMRDAKLLEIGGGTSEILRSIIVKEFVRKSSK